MASNLSQATTTHLNSPAGSGGGKKKKNKGKQQAQGSNLQEADRESVRKQVEFFFSRENLERDTYLMSCMDSEMWVDVEVVTHFKSLQALVRADPGLLASIMRESSVVTVSADGRKMRPNPKLERKTLILRDIPSETPKEEIEGIFAHLEDGSRPLSVTSEVGDNWFVQFDSEDKCVKAHLSLLGKKFKGNSIRARVKSETLMKSIFQPTTPAPGFAMYPMADMGYSFNGTDAGFGHNQNNPGGRRPRGGNGKAHRKGKKGGKRAPGTPQQVPVGPTHFPPLPGNSPESGASGYGSESFVQISVKSLFQTRKTLGKIAKPEFLTACRGVVDEPREPVIGEKPLTHGESAGVFEQCDDTPMSMSPFVSPFFTSVAMVPELPAEEMLTPPSVGWQPQRTRAVVEKTLSQSFQVPGKRSTVVPGATPVAPSVVMTPPSPQHNTPAKPEKTPPATESKPNPKPSNTQQQNPSPPTKEVKKPTETTRAASPPPKPAGSSFLDILMSPKNATQAEAGPPSGVALNSSPAPKDTKPVAGRAQTKGGATQKEAVVNTS